MPQALALRTIIPYSGWGDSFGLDEVPLTSRLGDPQDQGHTPSPTAPRPTSGASTLPLLTFLSGSRIPSSLPLVFHHCFCSLLPPKTASTTAAAVTAAGTT